ncbi:MAG: hypothetical protein HQL56_15135 [Magnetococcales bacterium]|nr:hypothetical protein [Magnetococcales bacterium]
MLRPRGARWFEMLVAWDDLPRAVEALGQLRSVELETDGGAPLVTQVAPGLGERLTRFQEYARQYQAFWPPILMHAPLPREAFLPQVDHALEQLSGWVTEAGPLIRALRHTEGLLTDMAHYQGFVGAMARGELDFDRLRQPEGAVLQSALFALPPEAQLENDIPIDLLYRDVTDRNNRFLLVVGPRESVGHVKEEIGNVNGRTLEIPDWFQGRAADLVLTVEQKLQHGQQEIKRLKRQLERLGNHWRIAEAAGLLDYAAWLLQNLTGTPSVGPLAHITGWTDRQEVRSLNRMLASIGVRGLLRFAEPVPGHRIPMLLANPAWVKPFEILPGLMGTPDGDDCDPSLLVAILAPLFFGYMFGDVGQGAVLLGAGWLWREHQAGKLLIGGGVMAILFGFLFGSFFCLEGVFPPWWQHALARPLDVLAWPLGAGVIILLTSQGLSALQAHWQGQGHSWLAVHMGVTLIYAGLLALPFPAVRDPGLALIVVGLSWHLFGHEREHPSTSVGQWLKGLLLALSHLPETLLQWLVNTLSFSRIGAFALAHAGLSQAVVALADASGEAYLLVLVAGNLLILALEGLVVSVQTTRLILFEFFIRFFRGEGRPFRPMQLPPGGRVSWVKEGLTSDS